jgi:uncharacterized membrane protein
MLKKNQIIQSAIAAVLALTSVDQANAHNTVTSPEMEKCYGIVKAGMNDCQTSDQSCAGSSIKDKQTDAFIFLPKGTCHKIVGGSLQPLVAQNADKNKK